MLVRLDNGSAMSDVVLRFDRATLGEPRRTEEGFLVTTAVMAKPGILYYRLPSGGFRRELVLPEELAADESVQTLEGKPITLEHPPEFVTPKNLQKHTQGTITKVRVDEQGWLVADLVVQGENGLAALDRGCREASPGYKLQGLDKTPGTHPVYGDYDVIQRGRRYNHGAITERARGGHECAFRTDALVEVDPSTAGSAGTTNREVPMLIAALIAAGLTKDAAERYSESIRSASTEDVRSDHASTLASKDAEITKANARADAAEKAAKEATSLESMLSWSSDRVKLENAATHYKLDSADVAKIDNVALARKVLSAASVDHDGRSDEWASARADSLNIEAPASNKGSAFAAVSVQAKQVRERSDSASRPRRSLPRSTSGYARQFEAAGK